MAQTKHKMSGADGYVGALPARHHQDDSQRAVEMMMGVRGE